MCWTVVGLGLHNLAGMRKPPSAAPGEPSLDLTSCYDQEAFGALAKLEPATVIAVSNIGPAILKHTRHRTLAGPYHRNNEGNIATLDALTKPPDGAYEILSRYSVELVVHCPGNDESGHMARLGPDGLMNTLFEKQPPEWLKKLTTGPETALVIFQVERK